MKIFLALIISALLLISLAAITMRFGLWPVSATATPPSWETSIAEMSLRASLHRQSAGLKNPVSSSSDVLLTGLQIFRNNCAGCHGSAAGPSQWGSDNFYPRVPQFARHPPRLSAPEMFVAIKYGVRYSGMGAWNGMLSDEQIWKTATFLEHIDSLPSEVQAAWNNQ
jgi:mono/diheme cytochrome c family protein